MNQLLHYWRTRVPMSRVALFMAIIVTFTCGFWFGKASGEGVRHVAPAPVHAEEMSSSLTHGYTAGCTWQWYIAFYQACRVVVQPGTVVDTLYPDLPFIDTGSALMAGGVGAACGPWAWICIPVSALYPAELTKAIINAVSNGQCVSFRWDQEPGIAFPFDISITAYGAPGYWVYVPWIGDRPSFYYWKQPTSCHMNDMKCPVPFPGYAYHDPCGTGYGDSGQVLV